MAPFRAWRQRLGQAQAQAAHALGRKKRSVEMLDRAEVVPRETDLACRWLEAYPEDMATPPTTIR